MGSLVEIYDSKILDGVCISKLSTNVGISQPKGRRRLDGIIHTRESCRARIVQ